MGKYVPEDIQWNNLIARWMEDPPRRCQRCGITYRIIDNVGSWQCHQPMYDPNNECYVMIPADHPKSIGEPYSEHNNITVAACAWPYLKKRVYPAAILPKAVAGRNRMGKRQVFAAVTIRRYDRHAWEKIRYGARQLDT